MKKEIYQVKETHVNKSKNYCIGEDSINIEDSIISNLEDLYKYGIKEYGKCISKVYHDKDGKAEHIGYVFTQRRKYEDTKEVYLAETWLTIEHYIETTTRKHLAIQ